MTVDYFARYFSLLDEVRAFNDRKLSEHADTAPGAGWNSDEAQLARFEQLLKVVEAGQHLESTSLTAYSDENKKTAEPYYADPCRYFDHCKRRYSRNVALYHDYSIFDLTVVVRKGEDPA